MGRIATWARTVALSMGAPGLFLVALLDSSFLSLPEIADILVVWMVTHNHARMVVYVIAATCGSLAGCSLLYVIGRKGGEALVRKRFAPANVQRAMGLFQRHGVLAVLIPAILPPPAPFKIFVLLAGVAQVRATKFLAAVAVGRGARYLVLGILAVEYGDRALAYLQAHGVVVALTIIGLLLAGLAGYTLWIRARQARGD